MARHHYYILFIAFIVLLLAVYFNLIWGGTEPLDYHHFSSNDFIFYQIRLPKMLTALIAGGALAVAGQLMQIVFKNPLAGPYVLGISSGASLAVGVLLLSVNTVFPVSIAVAAISGAVLVTFLVLAIAARIQSNVVLLIIGLMLAQIFASAETSLAYFADPSSLKRFVLWGMGSLGNASMRDLAFYFPLLVIALALTTLLFKPMNALLMGEAYANASGISFKWSRFKLILLSSLLTGLATALCGPISFVGLAVPVISRQVLPTAKQQWQWPMNLFLGSTVLLVSDILCHQAYSVAPLPLNMVTSLIGAPLVIWLMFKNKQW